MPLQTLLQPHSEGATQTIWTLSRGGDGRTKRAAWNALIESVMEPVDFTPGDWEAFAARLEVRGAPPDTLALVQTSPWKASTTAQHLSVAGLRSTFILFVISGSVALNQEGQRATAGAGEVCFVDGERLARIGSLLQSRFFSLPIPTDSPQARLLRSAGLSSLVLRRSDPAAKILSGLARSIWAALPQLNTSAAAAVISRLREVSTLNLCAVDRPQVQLTPHRTAMLARAQELVRRKISDPNLSPGLLAEEMKIGRRHLSQLFEGLGETPSDYIRRLRSHISWDLLQKLGPSESISQIAQRAGYGDQALFSRAMRSEFGVTPTQIRKMCDDLAFELEAIAKGEAPGRDSRA